MLGKARNYLKAAIEKIAMFQIRGAPRLMVYTFILLILLCITLFIGGWVFVWFVTSEPPLPIMIQFIAAITSVSFVAAIGFFGKALIDEDDNGIPDEFEYDESLRDSHAYKSR
ncbi:MAG: hypothetical protein IJ741_05565 [Schwartzia sp.]|nr:hypothetical protein [Schwartzia sp. (in: firmicutes)]